MSIPVALPLLLLLAQADGNPPWEEGAPNEDEVTVYTRERKGTGIHEIKAVGTFDAAPSEVWRVLRDYPRYKDFMPYNKKVEVIGSELGGKVLYVYCELDVPLLAPREYISKVTDDSDWRDGKGFLRMVWTTSDKGPPPRKGVVRLKVNDGFWQLVPTEEGQKTYALYYVYTDPGGAIPKWVVNQANSTMAPKVFRAVRHQLQKKR